MKILSKIQIQDWDKFTILHEPVSSLGLMERAAARCYNLFIQHLQKDFDNLPNKLFQIFCGQGNNGGDGLVIARYLKSSGYKVEVVILKQKDTGTEDFELNLLRCQSIDIETSLISQEDQIAQLTFGDIIIDAIYGTGLNAPLANLPLQLVNRLNEQKALKIAIDIPTGCFADAQTAMQHLSSVSFIADRTYTFQVPKSSFLFAETGASVGHFYVVDIDLHPQFLAQVDSGWHWIDSSELSKPQSHKFSYKWSKGHALIIGGTKGKMGAPLLASKAALRAGAGLLTSYIPQAGYSIFQTALPEVMVVLDSEQSELRNFPAITHYEAVCIGPGLGTHAGTIQSFGSWIQNVKVPILIDADGLNICAVLIKSKPEFKFPINSVITPHAKEFDRMFGIHNDSFSRLQTAIKKAQEYQIVIVLKGTYTQIISPTGEVCFNNTGNNLLATAGSGDVLSGIITSFMAQGLSTLNAAKYGVNLHGLLADSLQNKSFKHCIASDLVDELKFIV
jgi:NAD(P)H-hydrate epimerase